MDLQIDISGHDHLVRLARKFPHIIDEELAIGVNEAVDIGKGTAQRLVGVKTGHLRQSITSTNAAKIGGTISAMYGTNTLYAKYHEFGRGPIEARPGKMLRFEIKGKVFYRKRVKAAKGKFYMRDSKVKVQQNLPKIAKRVMNRVVARWAAGGGA